MTSEGMKVPECTLKALAEGSLGFASPDSPEDATVREMAVELLSVRAERDRMRLDFENREAACCPEDVGFEEFIAVLKKKLGQAEAERDRMREALDRVTEPISDEEWPKRYLRGRLQSRPSISRQEIDGLIFARRLNLHADKIFQAIKESEDAARAALSEAPK